MQVTTLPASRVTSLAVLLASQRYLRTLLARVFERMWEPLILATGPKLSGTQRQEIALAGLDAGVRLLRAAHAAQYMLLVETLPTSGLTYCLAWIEHYYGPNDTGSVFGKGIR